MMRSSFTKLAVGISGLALALGAGAGFASADPALDPIVNSTCNYSQFVAALNAQNPSVAALFNSSPQTQAGLRQFLAAGPEQRALYAQQIQSDPSAQPYLGIIQQAFNSCKNF